MHFPSYLRRTIYLPELGLAVNLDVAEPPQRISSFVAAYPKPQVGSRADLEALLVEECAPLIGVPSDHFLTFSNWNRQTELLKSIVGSDVYAVEMLKTYAGTNSALANTLRDQIRQHTERLNKIILQYTALPDFVGGFTRNGILGAAFSSPNRRFSLRLAIADAADEYGGTVFATASTSLLDAGMRDVDCVRWSEVTGALTYSPLPSVKRCYEALQTYQMPVTGSPSIQGLSLEGFRAACYGAAALVIGGTAYGVNQSLAANQAPSLVCVVSGVAIALVLVTVAPLGGGIVTYLDRIMGNKSDHASSDSGENPSPESLEEHPGNPEPLEDHPDSPKSQDQQPEGEQ